MESPAAVVVPAPKKVRGRKKKVTEVPTLVIEHGDFIVYFK